MNKENYEVQGVIEAISRPVDDYNEKLLKVPYTTYSGIDCVVSFDGKIRCDIVGVEYSIKYDDYVTKDENGTLQLITTDESLYTIVHIKRVMFSNEDIEPPTHINDLRMIYNNGSGSNILKHIKNLELTDVKSVSNMDTLVIEEELIYTGFKLLEKTFFEDVIVRIDDKDEYTKSVDILKNSYKVVEIDSVLPTGCCESYARAQLMTSVISNPEQFEYVLLCEKEREYVIIGKETIYLPIKAKQ